MALPRARLVFRDENVLTHFRPEKQEFDRQQRRGFTLVELLVTISIAAILLSLGVGGYLMMNKSLSYNAAGTLLQGKLMAARNVAIQEHSSTYVLLDARTNRVQTFGRVSTGFWHFDDTDTGGMITLTAGAFGQAGILYNGLGSPTSTTLAQGRYGSALSFPGPAVEDSLKLYVECGKSPIYIPVYNAQEGIALEAWVYPEDQPGGVLLADGAMLPVMAKIGAASPADQDYAPYALFLHYAVATKSFKAGALITLNNKEVNEILTPSALIQPRAWSHLAMTYANGGGGLRLSVNGIVRAESGSSITGQLFLNTRPLHIGHTEQMKRAGAGPTSGTFSGRIDEVILGIYQVSAPEQVSEKITAVVVNPANNEPDLGPYKFYFDSRGYLDRQFHSNLPEIIILSPLVSWQPEAHKIYEGPSELNDFRTRQLQTESQRDALAEGNRIHRLKFTWAGTVE